MKMSPTSIVPWIKLGLIAGFLASAVISHSEAGRPIYVSLPFGLVVIGAVFSAIRAQIQNHRLALVWAAILGATPLWYFWETGPGTIDYKLSLVVAAMLSVGLIITLSGKGKASFDWFFDETNYTKQRSRREQPRPEHKSSRTVRPEEIFTNFNQ